MYQLEFSKNYPVMYDTHDRTPKAKKIIAVLSDYFGELLNEKEVLDLGCSTGIMTDLYAEHVKSVVGIDIDEPAILHARAHTKQANTRFEVGDAADTGLPSESFDIVICAHVYEHVPDSRELMDEVYRVLKPGGVCFFAAGNRYRLIEGHYHLPLLSVFPKVVSHWYLRLMRKGTFYYENHLSFWKLRGLVSQFEIIDYTKKVIADPARFAADDMVHPRSFKQLAARIFSYIAYPFVPTYIWLLKKPT